MDKPILLTKDKLVQPIEQALERIEKIRQRKASNNDDIILEGLFALAVASFEQSLNDSLKVLLTHIPDKLKLKSECILKEELIDGNPLERAIENEVRSIGYKNLSDILKHYATTTGISEDFISNDEFDNLMEIKATRNLLLHNNLVKNNIYKETAGAKGRGVDNQRLIIDQDYLYQSLTTMKNILGSIKQKLSRKYASYTKVKATKNLFEYIFRTPVMVFENEFHINGDIVGGFKSDSRAMNSISTSERFFYDIWLAHSQGRSFQFAGSSIYHLDRGNIKKLEYFISVLDTLKS